MRGTTYAPEFKLKLVQQVINGEKRPAQLCREHNISEAILIKWRHAFAEKGEAAFKPASNELETLSRKRQLEKRVAELERMIRQLTYENSIFKNGVGDIPEDQRVEMISDTMIMHEGASTREPCRLLRVSRATTYRRQAKEVLVPLSEAPAVSSELEPVTSKSQPTQSPAVSEENIFLRDEIEQLVLKHPWHGYRKITRLLARKGFYVNRKRVLRIMQLKKLICTRKKRFVPKTMDSNHAFRCYPNLLEKYKPQGLDEVWHADLTYIRVKESFVYVV